MGKKIQKIVLPPELPPDVPEEDIEVSDEDMQFVSDNVDYAGFVSNLDTHSITKHVSRVADANEGTLESMYEKRLKRKLDNQDKYVSAVEVDPVDALPVKTLDGQLYYRRVITEPQKTAAGPKEDESISADTSTVRLSKSEKRAKFKKLRKEAKQQAKEDVQQTPQAEVLDEVKRDLNAEETRMGKKYKLAELGTLLLADPESNIRCVKEMLEISKDGDSEIVILSLKSLLAVFKDIIPGYRIRLPTEKEQDMKVSKAVKKTRFYESTLLSAYKAYCQKLVALQNQAVYNRVAVRCLCTLLAAVPHFNFRDSLLTAVVNNISSEDDVVRKLCCASVKSIFIEEGKHSGEATVDAVGLIADLVKSYNCQLHPDSVEVFMSLSFDEDIGKPQKREVDNRSKSQKFKQRKRMNEPTPLPDNERKKTKKEMMSKTREEVDADFKAASFAQDPQERKRMQSQTLSAVFQTYFRILKHATSGADFGPVSFGNHPLLAPCLDGIGKFAHLIDMDFMADLMNCLRKLAANGSKLGGSSEISSSQFTVSERLRCCIVAFKVMKNNLDALNVDLQDFYIQFYNLILEYRPGRDQGEVLALAMKIMLCDDRQHDTQRAAAFIKRLCTFALCFGAAEAMAALVTVKHLLQKNAKCRSLLENDSGGGSVAGSIPRYQPNATDPNLSGALASVLWELTLLTQHCHPTVSSMASTILSMATSNNQILHSHITPPQAYAELSQPIDSSVPTIGVKKSKSKKGNESAPVTFGSTLDLNENMDESKIRKKLSEHFMLLCDFQENQRLRSELDRASLSVNLYEDYKKQKKRKVKRVKIATDE